MPMERSVSCAERPAVAAVAAPTDLRCYSASYVTSYKAPGAGAAAAGTNTKVKRATSASAWSRPSGPVQRSGSTRTVSSGWGPRSGGPTPGFNLRSYSASYAASYSPFEDANPAKNNGGGGGGGGAAAATWTSSAAGRRSVNLRGYTPSFAALDDTAEAAPPIPAKNKQVSPASTSPSGSFVDDAELQRRKRLVAYKAYDVEGKVKDSVRRSVKWIKGKYSRAVDGKW
ncbi:homeobox even-skipped homolog protein 2-like [Oryza brachyantha]|uniref:homeobox even-skipped homolog protein 2-like n=1 Tax=Oryza brachyantha TaxID=4533 RepID=UPI001ADBD48C|nr:homeobox even-skipped homolog protein 2-like [Oryza brachyantha]